MIGDLERDGFARLTHVVQACECDRLITSIERWVADAEPAIRSGEGTVYAARNLLDSWPEAVTLWRRLTQFKEITTVLGPSAGLVRMLYFDKPPGQSWALPWHQDRTIAVAENRGDWKMYRHPTIKAGVAHLEAPEAILQQMLTLRVHLDEVTDENGPLKVVPGSHRAGKPLDLSGQVVVLHASRGEILLMRPLLAHASGRSHEGTSRHRRIVHLECAASAELPEGVQWKWFLPLREPSS